MNTFQRAFTAIIAIILVGGIASTAVALHELASIDRDDNAGHTTAPAISCVGYEDDVLNAHCYDRNGVRVGNYKEIAFSFGSAADRYIEVK